MYRKLICTIFFPVVLGLASCGGSDGTLVPVPQSNAAPGEDPDNSDSLEDVAVWKSNGTYANALYSCALADQQVEFCNLNTLPLLGMEVSNPGVQDIMGRLLVSHDWMAERFEQLLQQYPQEMLILFRGLTAIVIDDDIRPAYYWSATGAIYLDPNYLWTSVDEKQTINRKQDYRAGFSDPLSLRAWGRHLKNGTYAFNYGSLHDENPRDFNDVLLINARLLLHELAHVNDYLPYQSYDDINRSRRVYQAIDDFASGSLSDRLSRQQPLQSSVLSGLAKVMFHGDDPSAAQAAYSAAEAGDEFEADAAADMYSYSSQYEDVAMLFEVAMMKYFWDIDYQVAFVSPIGAEKYCNEYLIGWSATNWIADTDVKARAMYVTNELMPNIDLTLFYQDMPAPEYSSATNWCLPQPAGSSALSKMSAQQLTPLNPADFEMRIH
ncbi:hypothetical protein SAMN02745866_01484 [Alteromonadaceae bacterium Bs31]|nr:hypothetical protein SAMN02745866_01484 [Alteromonadaceae bacterium Bs31]